MPSRLRPPFSNKSKKPPEPQSTGGGRKVSFAGAAQIGATLKRVLRKLRISSRAEKPTPRESPRPQPLFYEDLPAEADFVTALREAQPVPPSWFVIITDVKNSTEAVEQGLYRQVNSLGVASIVVALNAYTDSQIPFVFGGDGATLLLPSMALETVGPALLELKSIARDCFGLEIRLGMVPVRLLPPIMVGKIDQCKFRRCPCSGNPVLVPVLEGDGLKVAEALVKGHESDFQLVNLDKGDGARPRGTLNYVGVVTYLLDSDKSELSNDLLQPSASVALRDLDVRSFRETDMACFDGFNCRWREFGPSGNLSAEQDGAGFLALIVEPIGEDVEERIKVYQAVLEEINAIAGLESPVPSDKLELDTNARTAGRMEAALLAKSVSGAYSRLLRAKILFYSWFAQSVQAPCCPCGVVAPCFSCLKEPVGVFRMRHYQEIAAFHTDFLKFDGTLRMVVAVTLSEKARILKFLAQQHFEGTLCYGQHWDANAQITCLVRDFANNHMHFIDVCGGGYTTASKQLKAQLMELKGLKR